MLTGKGLTTQLLLALAITLTGGCSGGDGTLFSGAPDPVVEVIPEVGDVQVTFAPQGTSDTEVVLTARVVDLNNQLLEGAPVRFSLTPEAPEGAFLVVDNVLSNATGESTARISFPPGFSDAIRVIVQVESGDETTAPIVREIDVTAGQEDVRPDVSNLVVEVDRGGADTTQFTVRAFALGALNQPLANAVIFIRLGSGAPGGVSIVVSNPITNAQGIVEATVRLPAGLVSPIPLVVSVSDPNSMTPPEFVTVLPPGVEGLVGGLQVVAVDAGTGNTNEIGLLARVVGQSNELLDGVRVFFDLDEPAPAGAFIRVPDGIANGDAGALAILTFPPGFTDSIDVLVSVQTGDPAQPVIQRTVSVALAQEEQPFVSSLQLRLDYDATVLDENEVLITALALGRFNELVDGATVFFRLGGGAPGGSSIRVPAQSAVTTGTSGVSAILTFPPGFTGAIPVIASVVGPQDEVPPAQSINVLSPFARVPVGGLQLVFQRIGDTAEALVTARVVDTNSALVAGVPVRFRLASNSVTGSFLRVTRLETDSDGAATAIVTFPSATSTATVGVFAEVDTGIGNGVISRGIDVSLGIEDSRPVVSDIELDIRQSSGNPNAVDILARVIDPGRGVVDGVVVAFAYGSVVPPGAQLFATQPVTSGAEGAVATLIFPPGFTNSIQVVASATGRGGSSASGSILVPSPIVVSEPEPDVGALRLIASATTLNSDADLVSKGITLTAIATDASNNLLEGATILFTSCELVNGSCAQALDQGGAGALLINRARTDANGTAEAVLTTSGNVRNRVIRVTASSRQNAAIQATFDVSVIGTTIALVGPASLSTSSSANYVATLRNAGGFVVSGIPVRFVSVAPNTVQLNSPSSLLQACSEPALSTVPTGPNGTATVLVQQPPANFVLLACALQNSVASAVSVSVSQTALTLAFAAPPEPQTTDINFGTCRQIAVNFASSDPQIAVAAQTVSLGITRGTIFSARNAGVCANPITSVQTDANGDATIFIDSSGPSGAGPATLSGTVQGASANLEVEFVAIAPNRVDVTAEPATVAVNGSSTIRAVVRDNNNNLVKNQTVSFNLQDPSGGSLSASNQVTDSQGRAEVTYTASGTTSARDAVLITASVVGTNPLISNQVRLTVGGDALRISLGTGNTIFEPNATTYQLPYSVIVTDSLGNPAPPETVFRLSVVALSYDKGRYEFVNPVWVPRKGPAFGDIGGVGPVVVNANPGAVAYARNCANEDLDRDGILDAGEDVNGDGILTPGNVVTVPVTIPLDADGKGQFNLTYAQQFGNWVSVELRAIAAVSGTEFTEVQTFTLPASADDLSDEAVAPPGNPSPFGVSGSCFDTN